MIANFANKLSRLAGALALSAVLASAAFGHTTTLPALDSGPYAMGSSTLIADDSAVSTMLAAGRDAGQYTSGANLSGERTYVASLLSQEGSTFTFDVQVPSDTALYGAMAGTKLAYAGVLFYPTASGNSDAQFFSWTLPAMHRGTAAIPFADAAARYPLLVMSHGAGGDPLGYIDPMIRKAVSRGYVVLGLFHGDNRFATTDAERLTLRPLAVKAAIDALQTNAWFKDHLDFSRIGGVGGSYGGTTMLALLGGRVWLPNLASTFNTTPTQTVTDERILAAATNVPYLGGGDYGPIKFRQFGSNGEGAQYVTRPFMANSGVLDTEAEYALVQEVFGQLQGTRYLVSYPNEGHAFSTAAWADSIDWMLLFLDAHVKGDATALAQLRGAADFAGNATESLAVAVDVGGSTAAACGATYTPANGTLAIPCVQVGADIYAATLSLAQTAGSLAFELQPGIGPTTQTNAAGDACLATYTAATNRLELPCVDIGGGTAVRASLELAGTGQGGGLLFRLVDYAAR